MPRASYRIAVASGSGDYRLHISTLGHASFRRRVTHAGTESSYVIDAVLAPPSRRSPPRVSRRVARAFARPGFRLPPARVGQHGASSSPTCASDGADGLITWENNCVDSVGVQADRRSSADSSRTTADPRLLQRVGVAPDSAACLVEAMRFVQAPSRRRRSRARVPRTTSRSSPVSSGSPHVNGDGLANDRAVIIDPATSADPALATGMRELFTSSDGALGRCLRSQLGRAAGPNSCETPWSVTLNAQVMVRHRRPQALRVSEIALNFATRSRGSTSSCMAARVSADGAPSRFPTRCSTPCAGSTRAPALSSTRSTRASDVRSPRACSGARRSG
jgi:hypothetical protein